MQMRLCWQRNNRFRFVWLKLKIGPSSLWGGWCWVEGNHSTNTSHSYHHSKPQTSLFWSEVLSPKFTTRWVFGLMIIPAIFSQISITLCILLSLLISLHCDWFEVNRLEVDGGPVRVDLWQLVVVRSRTWILCRLKQYGYLSDRCCNFVLLVTTQ